MLHLILVVLLLAIDSGFVEVAAYGMDDEEEKGDAEQSHYDDHGDLDAVWMWWGLLCMGGFNII
jgi:hypothetical protein